MDKNYSYYKNIYNDLKKNLFGTDVIFDNVVDDDKIKNLLTIQQNKNFDVVNSSYNETLIFYYYFKIIIFLKFLFKINILLNIDYFFDGNKIKSIYSLINSHNVNYQINSSKYFFEDNKFKFLFDSYKNQIFNLMIYNKIEFNDIQNYINFFLYNDNNSYITNKYKNYDEILKTIKNIKYEINIEVNEKDKEKIINNIIFFINEYYIYKKLNLNFFDNKKFKFNFYDFFSKKKINFSQNRKNIEKIFLNKNTYDYLLINNNYVLKKIKDDKGKIEKLNDQKNKIEKEKAKAKNKNKNKKLDDYIIKLDDDIIKLDSKINAIHNNDIIFNDNYLF